MIHTQAAVEPAMKLRKPMRRRLAAILIADAQGYSCLMSDDEAATVHTITEYREAIESIVARHGGRVVDTAGDNVLSEFPSVVDAVQCAVEIQRQLRSRNAGLPVGRRMQFRIGINLGDVIVETGRLYGDGVNIAARLEGLAEGGGICLSGTAYDQVEGKLPFGYEFLGEHTVKNIARPIRVYRLHPDASPWTLPGGRRGALRLVLGKVGAIVVLILIGAGTCVGWGWLNTPPSARRLVLPDKPSLAVVPFTNLTRDPSREYFNGEVTKTSSPDSRSSGALRHCPQFSFTRRSKGVTISDVGPNHRCAIPGRRKRTESEAIEQCAGRDSDLAMVPEKVQNMMLDYDRRGRRYEVLA